MKKTLPGPLIIGIAGQREVGKDTVARFIGACISRQFANPVVYDQFSDPLKVELAEAFGIPLAQLERQKAQPIVRWVMEQYGMTYPRLTTFVELLEERLKECIIDCPVYIVPGVRRKSEEELIHKYNGIVILVRRDYVKGRLTKKETLPSETELTKLKAEYTITNDDNLELLKKMVEALVEMEILKHVYSNE